MCQSGHGNVFIGQGQEPQLDFVAMSLPQGDLSQGFSRQKVTGTCGFASAVWFCNDDDFLQQKPLTIAHIADIIMFSKVIRKDLSFQ